MVAEYYKEHGEKVIITLPKELADSLAQLKLVYGRDYISEGSLFESDVLDDISSVNIIFHHYIGALSNCSEVTKSFIDKSYSVMISFYADGFVNVFLDLDAVKNLIVDELKLVQRHAFSFDKTMNFFKQRMPDIEHVEVQSTLLNSIFEKYGFEDIFSDVIAKFSDKKDEPFIALVMRPWGSETFHGGNYSLKDGGRSLSKIVNLIFQSIGCSKFNTSNFLYRRDNRDEKIMNEFEDDFIPDFNPDFFCDVGEFIPNWLTLDFFLLFFAKYISKDITLITFDSSTSLSLMPLGVGSRHVFGAPVEITLKEQKNQNMTKIFVNKVNISKEHIENSIIKDVYVLAENTPEGLAVYSLKGQN
jgi:hypothetical protein